jgi:predicted esterase
MKKPATTVTTRALLHGALIVTLGGLLHACTADAGADRGGAGPGSAGASAGTTAAAGNGGAAGSAAGGVSVAGDGASAGIGGAAGDGAGTSGGTAGTGAGGTGAGVVNAVCSPIVDGMSTVMVDGKARTFIVQMPKDTSEMALMFVWHGFMQNPATWDAVYTPGANGHWGAFNPDTFPMPLMIINAVSTHLFIPQGLDWDISNGATDLPYFSAMLQCIEEQYKIDTTRIYSYGFSAGAVFTNLLAGEYPGLFAATISASGVWFSDTPEQAALTTPGFVMWDWAPLNPADKGNVLLSHGGPKDFATVMDLEKANLLAVPYLAKNGRTVVECTHTFGHTPCPDLTEGMYYDYMWAHKLGDGPITALPSSFPTTAKPIGASACTFHAAP